jgi:transcriptional regulator with XRE-family HTH domain
MVIEDIAASVASVVTERLKAEGFTQVSLADKSGIPRTTLQRRLSDGDFTVSELARVARALRTTPDELVSRAHNAITAHA